MLRIACLTVAALLSAVGVGAETYDVSITCSGECRPEWDKGYWFTIDAAEADDLIGLTVKARNTEAGDPGCIGRGVSGTSRPAWPTQGGRAECRYSVALERTQCVCPTSARGRTQVKTASCASTLSAGLRPYSWLFFRGR